MKLTILQKGNYYCYLDGIIDKNDWKYAVELRGGWLGFKSGFSANTASILNKQRQILGEIRYTARLFKPKSLTIEFVEESILIDVKFLKRFRLFPLTFELNNKIYRFEGFRGHYKILYENDVQVASFDKKKVSFFNRDSFLIYAENHLNTILLIALCIFDDIWTNEGDAFTVDFGNVGFPLPPDKKQWKPSVILPNKLSQ